MNIPNEFKKWVRELNTLQKASIRKEEAITNSDPSFLIASQLVRNGITVLTPVEDALEIMKNKQNAGDTIELAIVMQKLPQQWSLYRIVLQHNAKDYFRKHLTETTDFMQQYFAGITFATMWNDVWMKYVEVAGGSELAILQGVQHNLLEAEKPSAKAARLEASARLRRAPEDLFPFNETELVTVCTQGLTAIETQIATQQTTITQLDKQLAKTKKRYTWLRTTAKTAEVTLHTIDELDPRIVENEMEQLTGVMTSVLSCCRTLHASDHLMESQQTLIDTMKAFENTRNVCKAAFEKKLEEKDWQTAYKKYVRASMDQIVALKLRQFFEQIQAEETEGKGSGILEMIQKSELTKEYGTTLMVEKNVAKNDYITSVKDLTNAAIAYDAAQYNYYVTMECEARFGRGETVDTDGIKGYLIKHFKPLANGSTPMSTRISGDSKDPLKDYCRGFKKINEEKKELAAKIKIVAINDKDALQDAKIVSTNFVICIACISSLLSNRCYFMGVVLE